jgi:hypothetical protein
MAARLALSETTQPRRLAGTTIWVMRFCFLMKY